MGRLTHLLIATLVLHAAAAAARGLKAEEAKKPLDTADQINPVKNIPKENSEQSSKAPQDALRYSFVQNQKLLRKNFNIFYDNIENWLANKQQTDKIQQSIQSLRQSYSAYIQRLNETAQAALAIPPKPAEPSGDAEIKTQFEARLRALENKFNNGVKALSDAVNIVTYLRAESSGDTTLAEYAAPSPRISLIEKIIIVVYKGACYQYLTVISLLGFDEAADLISCSLGTASDSPTFDSITSMLVGSYGNGDGAGGNYGSVSTAGSNHGSGVSAGSSDIGGNHGSSNVHGNHGSTDSADGNHSSGSSSGGNHDSSDSAGSNHSSVNHSTGNSVNDNHDTDGNHGNNTNIGSNDNSSDNAGGNIGSNDIAGIYEGDNTGSSVEATTTRDSDATRRLPSP